MTVTVYLVSGTPAVMTTVTSVDVFNGVLILYTTDSELLAGFASGQWKYFVTSH